MRASQIESHLILSSAHHADDLQGQTFVGTIDAEVNELTLKQLTIEELDSIKKELQENEKINLIFIQEFSVSATDHLGSLLKNRKINPLAIVIRNSYEETTQPLLQHLSHNDTITITIKIKYDDWAIDFTSAAREDFVAFAKDPHCTERRWDISYSYRDQEILGFTMKNFLVKNLRRYHPIAEINLPPNHFPPADLIKSYAYFVGNKKYDQTNFQHFILNYLSGPLVDQLNDQLELGIVISIDKEIEPTFYSHILEPVLKQEQVLFHYFYDACWLRDATLSTRKGQLLNPVNILNKYEYNNVLEIAKRDDNSHRSTNSPIGGEGILGSSDDEDRQAMIDYCETENIDHEISRSVLEGGNIHTTINTNGLFVIFGKNLSLYNGYRNYQNNHHDAKYQAKLAEITEETTKKIASGKKIITPSKQKLRDKLAEYNIPIAAIKEARRAIEELLRIHRKQAVWIPNADFHIDLMLTQGPNNIIFMNSHKMVAKLYFQKYNNTGKNEYYKSIYQLSWNLHLQTRQQLKRVKDKLEKKCGVKVVKVPANVYIEKKYYALFRAPYKIPPHIQVKLDKNTPDETPIMLTSFINAYTGIKTLDDAAKTQEFFYITLKSRTQELEDNFAAILKENGVKNVHFLGSVIAAEDIHYFNGSLRCMSASCNVLSNVAKQSIFHQAGNDKVANTIASSRASFRWHGC